jgi:Mce-associated membrane protein
VVLCGLLAVVCVVGAVQVAQARDTRAQAATHQMRYAAVLDAASLESTAFVNVSHDSARADLARIAAGATGPLKDRYTSSADRFVRALRRDRTVTEGSVEWSAVVSLEETRATVIVATTGTRADRRTKGEAVSRNLRLRLELVLQDGHWLTSDIRYLD